MTFTLSRVRKIWAVWLILLKGTVQWELRWVKIGINRTVRINCIAGKCHLPCPKGHHHEMSINQGDDSSPPPLCGLIFFEGDRCLCLTLKFVERLKCYSAKPNESCIIFGIYYFISCLISIVILSLCIFLFLLSFLVRYRVKTMQEKEKMCQTVA
jgi:hypothetical protein